MNLQICGYRCGYGDRAIALQGSTLRHGTLVHLLMAPKS